MASGLIQFAFVLASGIINIMPNEVGAESWLGVRHLQALMLFLGMVFAFGMRVNISIALVAMTDPSNENYFDWSIQRQTVILSSFFWGYVLLQVPGGVVASRFGSKFLLIGSIGIHSAVTLLIPAAAYYGGWKAVSACKVLQGLSQGCLYPSMHNIIGKWMPLDEKSRLGSAIYSGGQLGIAVQLLVSGHAEKMYIETSLGQVGEQKKLKTPWKKLFTSVPFIALIITHCGQTWGFWSLVPTFMKQVLGVDIKATGLMSALPYLAMYLMSFPMGFISDYVIRKKWLSTSATRKISNSIGMWGPAIALVCLTYAPANATIAVGLLTVAFGLNAGHYTGFQLVHLDMSPNFAGTMLGITNSIASLVSIAAPLVAGAILTDETDIVQWRTLFFISSIVYFVCNLVLIIFGTSERQEWDEPKTADSKAYLMAQSLIGDDEVKFINEDIDPEAAQWKAVIDVENQSFIDNECYPIENLPKDSCEKKPEKVV
ncbi:hypothetical protein ACJJTC_013997 [Scirpophaga incertulas]